MQQGQLSSKIMLVIVLLLLAVKFFVNKTSQQNTNKIPTTTNTTPQQNTNNNNTINNIGIPQKVISVLNYIQQNHRAIDGYVGGRVFTNFEKVVPTTNNNGQPITYQEWDVNPHVQGINRGTERILTGSDGRAWYTNDHYKTFTQIK